MFRIRRSKSSKRERRSGFRGVPEVYLELAVTAAFSGNIIFIGNMARPRGVEPPTFWFVARRSIQLSYGRAAMHLLLR